MTKTKACFHDFGVVNSNVIPREIEAATQPRKLSGRGQAFNPVALLFGSVAESLDCVSLR